MNGCVVFVDLADLTTGDSFALAPQEAEQSLLEGAVHQAVQHGVLSTVGMAQKYGEGVQGDQMLGHEGTEVQTNVDYVVGQPTDGKQERYDDHH